MSIDLEADGRVMDVPSPIRAGTMPPTTEKEIEGLRAALGILLDETTELRARVAAIENRAAGLYTADDAKRLALAIDARISAIEATISDDGR